jgi:hypothetical protein
LVTFDGRSASIRIFSRDTQQRCSREARYHLVITTPVSKVNIAAAEDGVGGGVADRAVPRRLVVR